jgi:hypothetical protein
LIVAAEPAAEPAVIKARPRVYYLVVAGATSALARDPRSVTDPTSE